MHEPSLPPPPLYRFEGHADLPSHVLHSPALQPALHRTTAHCPKDYHPVFPVGWYSRLTGHNPVYQSPVHLHREHSAPVHPRPEYPSPVCRVPAGYHPEDCCPVYPAVLHFPAGYNPVKQLPDNPSSFHSAAGRTIPPTHSLSREGCLPGS